MLDTYRMVDIAFLIKYEANQVRLFEETFLVANINLEIVFKMSFLTLNGVDVDFLRRELEWRTYTTKKTFLTTRHIKPVSKKVFAVAALDPEHETYVVHIGSVSFIMLPSSSPLNADVHSFSRLQISSLIVKEALIKVLAKYSDLRMYSLRTWHSNSLSTPG